MGGRGYGGGEEQILYLSLHCHHLNDFCIKVGSDESYFNVSLIVRDKVTTWDRVHKPQHLKRKESEAVLNRGPSDTHTDRQRQDTESETETATDVRVHTHL